MGMTTATSLWRGLCALAVIIPTAANAQAWFAADCTIQNGEKVAAFVSEGQARISYGEEGSSPDTQRLTGRSCPSSTSAKPQTSSCRLMP